MQMMSDAITVLGSRHGIYVQPCAGKTHLIRHGEFPGTPFELQAGVTVDGRTLTLPLSRHGENFRFVDQDITPTAMKITGIDPETTLKLEWTATAPFRPRDPRFSTAPVIDLRLRLSTLGGNFRWVKQKKLAGKGEIFMEISCPEFQNLNVADGEIRWEFDAPRPDWDKTGDRQAPPVREKNALVVHRGTNRGKRIVCPFVVENGSVAEIHVSWCIYSPPALTVRGTATPFKYTEYFSSLDDVANWTRSAPDALAENSAAIDGVFAQNNLSSAVNHLLALTLHSWLANTWWTKTPDDDWFSVWEGSCYYHSTVDVEYTQTPFYMCVWPELLGLELDQWPHYVSPGTEILGEHGKDTVFFMHDCGQFTECNTTRYHHPMPVEENANYVLMSYAYWRRTNDFTPLGRHADLIEKALDFIVACDTTGNGVPDRGMANTIDDASPAVQFGKEQVYLAVKALAAFETGAEILAAANRPDKCRTYIRQAEKIRRVVLEKGFRDDHFVTLLDPSARGVEDAWSGNKIVGDKIPGWDACHIYTANGLALLDMLGRDVGIDNALIRRDILVAAERCLDKYGCRHSDYVPDEAELSAGEGGTVHRPRIGWISMNMLRDIAGFYRKVDLRDLATRYWDYQTLVNTQGPHLFFETFNGNNLMTYPRGVAVFGFFDALAGARIDRRAGKFEIDPLSADIRVPLLLYADWQKGAVPVVHGGEIASGRELIG